MILLFLGAFFNPPHPPTLPVRICPSYYPLILCFDCLRYRSTLLLRYISTLLYLYHAYNSEHILGGYMADSFGKQQHAQSQQRTKVAAGQRPRLLTGGSDGRLKKHLRRSLRPPPFPRVSRVNPHNNLVQCLLINSLHFKLLVSCLRPARRRLFRRRILRRGHAIRDQTRSQPGDERLVRINFTYS